MWCVPKQALGGVPKGVGSALGGLPAFGASAAMSMSAAQPVLSAYPSFDSIWSTTNGEALPIGAPPLLPLLE